MKPGNNLEDKIKEYLLKCGISEPVARKFTGSVTFHFENGLMSIKKEVRMITRSL